MRRPADPRWWAAYVHWTTLVAVVWLVLAAAGVPWLAIAALLPCCLLPFFLSFRGPLAGHPFQTVTRFACLLVPMLVIHMRNPDYTASIRGPAPPVWKTGILTMPQIWAQIAAWELAALFVVEAFALGRLWWARRRRGLGGPIGPRVESPPGDAGR
ncbi:MAG TPA: hypothetical protein VGK18_04880 [Propionicimonas sp.]|uniref:hypothetical protein n=1 Tax=Propionicimonas sp. TaxID=1955623 RepID=UPI002F3FE3C2